jgi:WD40 repeat protein
MKIPLLFRTIVVPLIFLIACQTQTRTVIPTPTATATIIPAPSATSTSTPDPEIISPENVSALVPKLINMGKAQGSPVFSTDGKWLYQQSTAGTYAFDTASYQDVRLLASIPAQMLIPDAQTFTNLEALTGFAVYEQSIFSSDGSLIAGYFQSGLTTVWRLTDGKLINQFDGQPIEISPDNRLITIERRESFETYTRYYVDLYDLQTGEKLDSWGMRRAFFLPDNRLVIESSDGYTHIFDPVTLESLHAFPGWYAAFSPNEQNVAVLYGNQVNLYQVSNGKLLHSFDSGLPSTDAAKLCFSGNGEILAGFTTEYYCCAGYSNKLFVWQVSDGNLLADLSRPETLGQRAEPPISLSFDGQTIVIDSRVLQVSDGALIKDIGTYFIDTVTNLAFTMDGQNIIVLETYGKV